MKNTSTDSKRKQGINKLADSLAAISDTGTIKSFLQDLCSPSELEALADRWQVVPELIKGQSYRKIHTATGVSVTTIGRVAKCLQKNNSGYRKAHQLIEQMD